MLVLSRRAGESVVVGEKVDVKVEHVNTDTTDITVTSEHGKPAIYYNCKYGDKIFLMRDADMLIGKFRDKQVRLGFIAPIEIKVARKELLDGHKT